MVETLNNLLSAGLISFDQFLERIPSGLIPDVTGLREDIKAAQQMPANSGEITDEELLTTLQQQYPEQYNALMNMPEQQRAATLTRSGQYAYARIKKASADKYCKICRGLLLYKPCEYAQQLMG